MLYNYRSAVNRSLIGSIADVFLLMALKGMGFQQAGYYYLCIIHVRLSYEDINILYIAIWTNEIDR